MMSSEDLILELKGSTVPPPDLMEAARLSLDESAMAALMEQTGGLSPTPEQLCAMADSMRQATR